MLSNRGSCSESEDHARIPCGRECIQTKIQSRTTSHRSSSGKPSSFFDRELGFYVNFNNNLGKSTRPVYPALCLAHPIALSLYVTLHTPVPSPINHPISFPRAFLLTLRLLTIIVDFTISPLRPALPRLQKHIYENLRNSSKLRLLDPSPKRCQAETLPSYHVILQKPTYKSVLRPISGDVFFLGCEVEFFCACVCVFSEIHSYIEERQDIIVGLLFGTNCGMREC